MLNVTACKWGVVFVHGHHGSIPPLTAAPTGTGLTPETRFEAAIACSFDEDQTQPFSLAHLTLGASSPSQSLSGPTHLPLGTLRLPLWPCYLRAQVPRAAALQEVWVQVSKAVTAARLLPGESPRPSICQDGCGW